MITDFWGEGYHAGMNGATYGENPYEGKQGAAAWAFGCSEGMKDRNKTALRKILSAIAGE